MDILVGAVVVALGFALICRLEGDGGRSYDEYRRVEFHNEYLCETKERSDYNGYLLDISALRHP